MSEPSATTFQTRPWVSVTSQGPKQAGLPTWRTSPPTTDWMARATRSRLRLTVSISTPKLISRRSIVVSLPSVSRRTARCSGACSHTYRLLSEQKARRFRRFLRR